MGKKIILIIILLFLGATFYVASFFFSSKKLVGNPADLKTFSEKEVLQERLEEQQITIFLVGDIMLDRGVEFYVQREGGGDWRFPFLKIAQDLQKADILFGNLEGPISDKGRRVGSIYSFRANPEAVEGLKYAGFSILSLANNHAFDYGRIALEQTMEILKENSIDYVGAGFDIQEAFAPKILEVKNTKIAFLAFTDLGPESWQARENRPGIAWIAGSKEVLKALEKTKEKANIIVVSLHSGNEYSLTPTPFQTSFAKVVIEAGADLIVGHHPHVIQPFEQYKEDYIFYSLGNFVFDQGFSEKTMSGLLLEVKIVNKKIKEVIPRETKLNQFFQPEILD